FAEHATLAEHLVGTTRFLEWQPLRYEGLDLTLLEQAQQCQQVVAEPGRLESHRPLYAVRRHALSAGPEPVADDVPPPLGRCSKGMASLTGQGHASPAHFRLETVYHDAAALPQRIAGAPQIISANSVEHGVNADACKTTNRRHEILVLVVDGDAAQFPNH